jgi:uncharacterized coiled-coil DUF342 family protein
MKTEEYTVTHSLSTLALMTGTAFVAVVYLALRAHKEMGAYIQELQFFLKQRIIAHNKSQARLAVAQSRLEKVEQESKEMSQRVHQLEEETRVLRMHLQQADEETDRLQKRLNDLNQNEPKKRGLDWDQQFVQEQASHIEKLELEVSSIQSLLSNDIRAQITEYMNEVDGLTQKLKTAREKASSQQA